MVGARESVAMATRKARCKHGYVEKMKGNAWVGQLRIDPQGSAGLDTFTYDRWVSMEVIASKVVKTSPMYLRRPISNLSFK